MIALLLALPLAAAPAPPAAAAAPQNNPGQNNPGGAQDPPPIQEEGEFYILNFSEAEGVDVGMKLEEFVKICQQATGLNFTYTKETRPLLQADTVRMFGTKRIPKDDFYRFFQIMMFINDFATIEVGPDHLKVIVIQSLQQASARSGIQQRALYVLPDDLEQYKDQPAVLVRTVITLPNTDVRQLTTSLRPLLPDQSTGGMLNAGSSNSLILTNFGTTVYHLAQLLYIIDEASAVEDEVLPVFDVIPLEFASAEDVADIIEQLLEALAQTVEQQARQRGERAAAQGVSAQLSRTSQGDAKILTDPRTNSLLVMAMAEDMSFIRDMIARLDVDVVEPERNYHIVALENVAAADLADVLEDFLRDASRIDTQGGRTQAPQGTPGTGGSSSDNEVVVVPDPGTNSLLIAASKTRFEEVLDLVQQLDRRQDQVLIETALIELTGSKVRDIGVELGGARDVPPGEGDLGQFGVSSFGLSSFVDTDDDGVPDARVPNLMGGLTAGILDGDDFALPVLLAAIQTKDDTNVLNVPSVLVNNNGFATVRTLDERPTTTITATGGVTGQTQENFDSFQESGITLQISPSISASRYLRLGINLEVSTFVGTFTGGSIPPPRITRSIDTTVNVPDGDTMVIGGIVTDNENDNRSSIPFLGDLPLVGWIFGRQSKTRNVTTLYFFVTPHILHDRDFADLAEFSYRKKLDAAEVMGAARMRIIDPAFGSEEDERALRSFELPLYRSPASGHVDGESLGIDPARRNELLLRGRQEAAPAPISTEPQPLPAFDLSELAPAPAPTPESGAEGAEGGQDALPQDNDTDPDEGSPNEPDDNR